MPTAALGVSSWMPTLYHLPETGLTRFEQKLFGATEINSTSFVRPFGVSGSYPPTTMSMGVVSREQPLLSLCHLFPVNRMVATCPRSPRSRPDTAWLCPRSPDGLQLDRTEKAMAPRAKGQITMFNIVQLIKKSLYFRRVTIAYPTSPTQHVTFEKQNQKTAIYIKDSKAFKRQKTLMHKNTKTSPRT